MAELGGTEYDRDGMWFCVLVLIGPLAWLQLVEPSMGARSGLPRRPPQTRSGPPGTVGSVLATPSPQNAPPEDLEDLEREMARLVNLERKARGIPPLKLLPRLSEAARRYSELMASSGKVSHDADGRDMEDRIRDVVPDACQFGENISKHYTVGYALGDMLGSEGHRANLLNPRFTGIGIGVVRGKGDFLYITQNFLAPCQKAQKRLR
ncbi:MAG: CAP domain-containing protein [Acidobacteriota bacterium]